MFYHVSAYHHLQSLISSFRRGSSHVLQLITPQELKRPSSIMSDSLASFLLLDAIPLWLHFAVSISSVGIFLQTGAFSPSEG